MAWAGAIFVVIPIFSGFVWLGMLLGMFCWWTVVKSSEFILPMETRPGDHIAYISDVGANVLQPLFIAAGTTSVVTFTSCFVYERWLRHKGTLAHNTSRWQKFLSTCATIFALVGMIGLIILTCENDVLHGTTHDACLVLFIGGYIISAIFICWEYQRLGIHYRKHRILAYSFWIKLVFIFIELGLAIAFGTLGHYEHYNAAAVCEWTVALIYTFYVWSFAIDFIPAVRTRHYAAKDQEDIGMAAMHDEPRNGDYDGSAQNYTEGTAYPNGRVTNGARNF